MDKFIAVALSILVVALVGTLIGKLMVMKAKRSLALAQREKLDVARVALEIIMGRVVPKDQGMWKVTPVAPDTLHLELLSTLAMNKTQQDRLNEVIFMLINEHELAVQVTWVEALPSAQ